MKEVLQVSVKKKSDSLVLFEIRNHDESVSLLIDKEEAKSVCNELISLIGDIDYYFNMNNLAKNQIELIKKSYEDGFDNGCAQESGEGVTTEEGFNNFKEENNLNG